MLCYLEIHIQIDKAIKIPVNCHINSHGYNHIFMTGGGPNSLRFGYYIAIVIFQHSLMAICQYFIFIIHMNLYDFIHTFSYNLLTSQQGWTLMLTFFLKIIYFCMIHIVQMKSPPRKTVTVSCEYWLDICHQPILKV